MTTIVRLIGGPVDPRTIPVENIGAGLRVTVQPFGCADEYRYSRVNSDQTMADAEYQRTVGTGPQLRAYRAALAGVSRGRVWKMKTKRQHGTTRVPVRATTSRPPAERANGLPESELRRGVRAEG